jgi:hypothetical protein
MISGQHKKNHRHKSKKTLISVSPKTNLGIITAVKWTIQKFTSSIKHNPDKSIIE